MDATNQPNTKRNCHHDRKATTAMTTALDAAPTYLAAATAPPPPPHPGEQQGMVLCSNTTSLTSLGKKLSRHTHVVLPTADVLININPQVHNTTPATSTITTTTNKATGPNGKQTNGSWAMEVDASPPEQGVTEDAPPLNWRQMVANSTTGMMMTLPLMPSSRVQPQ
jgi:hypothetical protein